MIPYSQLNRQALGNLLDYILFEIRTALSERAPFEEKWKRWQKMYRCEPEQLKKDFPFRNAANIVVPVMATDIETTWARMMGILWAPGNLWSTKARRPELVDYRRQFEEFMSWAQDEELNMYDVTAEWLLELIKLGTGILKTRYRREQRYVYEYRETAQGLYQGERLLWLHDHPEVSWVPLVDALMPSGHSDIQAAPWFGHRLWLTWGQLVERVNAGVYQNPMLMPNIGTPGLSTLEPIRQWWANQHKSSYDRYKQELDYVVPGRGDRFEVWEVWTDFAIDNTGHTRALVCTIHPNSGAYLRVDYNPWFNQEKPFDVARYMRKEGSFYGIGLGEMLDQIQEEVTTMHNQRLDNATVSNSTMIAAPDNGNFKQDEPIYPGRMWLTANPQDIRPIAMGQKYDSTIPNEQLTLSYGSRRTGVSDFMLGQNSPDIGYAKATTNVMLYREGAQRFDQVLREVRSALSGAGTKVAELYQQFNQGGKPYQVLGDKDGAAVDKVLHFPTDLIRFGLAIDVTATNTALNKEVSIRTNTLLLQMQRDNTQQMLQLLMLALNPQLPPVVKVMLFQSIESAQRLLRMIFEDHGVQDADTFVPSLREMLNNVQSSVPGGGSNPLGGLGGPAIGPGADPTANAAGGPPLLGPPVATFGPNDFAGAGGPGGAGGFAGPSRMAALPPGTLGAGAPAF